MKQGYTRRAVRRLGTFMASSTARRLILGLFVAQALVLVFSMRFATPPDETNHIQFINYYANHSVSPFLHHQQPTYYLGDKTREVDYLYHYSMSWVVRVLPFSTELEQYTIRIFSVIFGLLTFLVLVKVLEKLGLAAGVINVSLLIITNLPMVLMLSSAINNDVFVWLGVALGFLLLIRLWEKPTAVDLAWLLALSLLGGLVKRDLLPFGLAFGLLGLVLLIKNFGLVINSFKRPGRLLVLASLVLIMGFGLFVERVGGNLVQYHKVVASCNEVQGEAACSNFWDNIRARQLADQRPQSIALPTFAHRWAYDSLFNVVDIQTQAWRHEVKPARWLVPLLAVMLLAGLAVGLITDIAKPAADRLARYRLLIMFIALFYLVVLLLVNYGTFRHYRVYGVALNGRYALPSLLVLGPLAAHYWSRLLKRQPVLLAGLSLLIVLGTLFGSGLLMMLGNPQLIHG